MNFKLLLDLETFIKKKKSQIRFVDRLCNMLCTQCNFFFFYFLFPHVVSGSGKSSDQHISTPGTLSVDIN